MKEKQSEKKDTATEKVSQDVTNVSACNEACEIASNEHRAFVFSALSLLTKTFPDRFCFFNGKEFCSEERGKGEWELWN